MRTPPATMQAVWSSSKAGQSPLDHDIGAKAVHRHRRLAARRQAFVQLVQRRLVGHQQRKPVGKAEEMVAGEILGPFGWRSSQVSTHSGLAERSARRSILSRRHGSPRKRLSHSAQRGCSARAITVSRHTPTAGCARPIPTHPPVCASRPCPGAQHQHAVLERRADARHLRILALGHELAGGRRHHPAAIVRQAGAIDARLGQVDAGAGFERDRYDCGCGWTWRRDLTERRTALFLR